VGTNTGRESGRRGRWKERSRAERIHDRSKHQKEARRILSAKIKRKKIKEGDQKGGVAP